jgi:hypothetical protein
MVDVFVENDKRRDKSFCISGYDYFVVSSYYRGYTGLSDLIIVIILTVLELGLERLL